MDPRHIRPRFEAASSDAASGAGKEAECRYLDLVRKRSYFDISAISVDSHSHLFSMRGLGSRARPDGLDRRERTSGALESAIAVSRARVRKGDVSRPERSGGRVTATQRQCGSPNGADGSGCKSSDGTAAERGPGGRLQPRGRAGEYGGGSGAQSRRGATPRRDPGDCNATTILFMFERMSGASEGRGAIRGKAQGPAV